MTEAQARVKGVRISVRKVRLVADAIRNLPVEKAMQVLMTTEKRASIMLAKALKSSVANAVLKGAKQEDLLIVRIEVDGGATLRRMHIGSRSHVRMYTKRSSHVRIVVSDKKDTAEQKKQVKKEVQKAEKQETGKKEEKREMKKEKTEKGGKLT